MAKPMQKASWIVLIAGASLLLVSLAALVISVLIPIVNAPRTSWDEAMLGIVPSGGCSCLSLMILLVGVVLLVVSRRK
jgi:hypothetical protein